MYLVRVGVRLAEYLVRVRLGWPCTCCVWYCNCVACSSAMRARGPGLRRGLRPHLLQLRLHGGIGDARAAMHQRAGACCQSVLLRSCGSRGWRWAWCLLRLGLGEG